MLLQEFPTNRPPYRVLELLAAHKTLSVGGIFERSR